MEEKFNFVIKSHKHFYFYYLFFSLDNLNRHKSRYYFFAIMLNLNSLITNTKIFLINLALFDSESN